MKRKTIAEQKESAQLTGRIPMTHRTGAKITAFIALMILPFLFIGTVLGTGTLFDEGFYWTAESVMRDGLRQERAENHMQSLAQTLFFDGDPALQLKSTNVTGAAVHIRYDNQKDTVWKYGTLTETPYEQTYTQDSLDRLFGGYYYDDEFRQQLSHIRTVSVSLSVSDVLTEYDDFYWMDLMVTWGYRLRFVLPLIAAVSFLLGVWCYIFLLRASGWHGRDSEVRPGWGTAVAPDVLTAGFLAAEIILLQSFWNWMDWGSTIGMILGLLVMGVLFVGWSMSMALRIKLGGLWHSCLLYRMFRNFTQNLPLIWKTALILGLLTMGELIGIILFSWRNELLLILWFLEKLILIPVILAAALMLRRLQKAGQALAAGDLSYQVDTGRMIGDFKAHGENLNHIAEGMTAAVEQRLKSERMKTELITNVSHDIKTPLTSLINYSDLIEKEPTDNERITEYAKVLHRQSERLKRLIEDLVEASKASTGNLEVHLAPCEVGVLLSQAVGEYEQRLEQCRLELVIKQPETPLKIIADGRRLWRVFDNMMNNICKYALPGTRVYLTLEKEESDVLISFKNISRQALDLSPDELMERFVRGDTSRTTEGNGLGLSIAKSLCELQNGSLSISIDGDLFKVVLRFPSL